MFFKVLIISLILIAIAVTGLAIRILAKRNGQFPETHVGRNKEMQRLGIKCAQHTDIGCNGDDNRPECRSCNLRIKGSRQ